MSDLEHLIQRAKEYNDWYYIPCGISDRFTEKDRHIKRSPSFQKSMAEGILQQLNDVNNLANTASPKEKKKEKIMGYNTAVAVTTASAGPSEAQVKIDYLLSRARSVKYDRDDNLAKIFHLYVDNTPKTFKDLIDAIKNDKFKLDEERTKKILEKSAKYGYYYGPLDGIIFDGPEKDRDGYNVAVNELEKKYIELKDTIQIKSADEALDALRAFETWLPSNAPTTVQ